jgi:hypothetical protein
MLGVMLREARMRSLMVTAMMFAARLAGFIGRGVMLVMSRRMGVAARRALLIAMRGLRPIWSALARGVALFSASIRAGIADWPAASPLGFVSPALSLVWIISVTLGQNHVRVVIALVVPRLGVALRSLFVLGNGPKEGRFPCSQAF